MLLLTFMILVVVVIMIIVVFMIVFANGLSRNLKVFPVAVEHTAVESKISDGRLTLGYNIIHT